MIMSYSPLSFDSAISHEGIVIDDSWRGREAALGFTKGNRKSPNN